MNYKCTQSFYSVNLKRAFSYNQVISELEYDKLSPTDKKHFIKRDENSLQKHHISGSDFTRPDIIQVAPDIVSPSGDDSGPSSFDFGLSSFDSDSSSSSFDFGSGDFGGGGASGDF